MPGLVFDLCTLHPPSFSTALFLLCMGMLSRTCFYITGSRVWAGQRQGDAAQERDVWLIRKVVQNSSTLQRGRNSSSQTFKCLQQNEQTPAATGIRHYICDLHSPASGSSPECAMLAPSLQTSCNTGYSAQNSASAAAVWKHQQT